MPEVDPKTKGSQRRTRRLKTQWQVRFDESVTALAWSDDGRHLVVGTADGAIHQINVASAGQTTQHFQAHSTGVHTLEWWPRSDQWISLSEDGVVAFWRVGHHSPLWRLGEGSHWGSSLVIAKDQNSHSPVQAALACGKQVRWLDSAGKCLASSPETPHTIEQLSWPHPAHPVVGCGHGGFRFWNPQTGKVIGQIDWPDTFWNTSTSPDGRWLVGSTQTRQVHLWKLSDEEHFHMPGYPAKVRKLTWTDDSRWLVTASGLDLICWPCEGAGPAGRRPRLFAGHAATITSVAVPPGKHILVSGGEDGRLILWNLDGDEENEVVGAYAGEAPINCLRWSSQGTMLAAGTREGQLWIF